MPDAVTVVVALDTELTFVEVVRVVGVELICEVLAAVVVA